MLLATGHPTGLLVIHLEVARALRAAGCAVLTPDVAWSWPWDGDSDWVAGGREVTITSDGAPKARLVPASPDSERKVFRGMGRFLSSQPVHGGPSAEEVIRDDRDGRGW